MLLALAPFVAWLGADWLSDDLAILGYVHREALGADLTTPQFGMHAVRFWRPVVTASWDVVEAGFGPHPLVHRAVNVGALLAAAWLALVTLAALRPRSARAGETTRAAAALVLFLTWFPYSGGTVIWLAGRTDLLATVLLFAGVVAALGERRAITFLLAIVGLATKETTVVLPVWAAACLWARGGTFAEAVKKSLPATLGVAVGLGVRRLAIGSWVGGYPSSKGLSGVLEHPLGALAAWLEMATPTLAILFALVLVGAVAKTLDRRLVVAGLVAGAAAVVPLLPLLGGDGLGTSNARLLFPSAAGFALVGAGAVLRPARSRVAGRVVLAALAFALGTQAVRTTLDARAWAHQAELSEARYTALSSRLEREPRTPLPVLVDELPATLNDRYLFAFGIADRFRAPFVEVEREVWPLRPLFGFEDSRRAPSRTTLDGERGNWRALEVTPNRVHLDLSLLSDAANPTTLEWTTEVDAAGRLEALLFTPSGYEVAHTFQSSDLSLRTLLLGRGDRFSLAQAWMQAVDLGAERTYLELRWLVADGTPFASEWIELTWDDGFETQVARALGFE